MLNSIITFSVKNKLLIGLCVMALIAYGIYQATKLPIDAVPDITNNQVQIITIAPSYGATDIERLVTFPIEQANSNISGMKEIRSFSRFGLSLVTIVFNDETDIYWARQQVAERLQQVQNEIPKDIGSPTLGPISTGLGEIYQYVVKPKKGFETKFDATELRTIQDWIVRRQLLGVKGVAEVSSFGGKLKQYEIAINVDKLHAHGITINDVFHAVESNNENTGGSYIEKGPIVLYIRSEGLIGNIEDIENIAIPNEVSKPLFIRDVAEVKTGFATRYGAMCYNDEGEVSGAIVMMLKGANSSEVIKNVKTRIEQIQKTLPEGVEIEPFLDRTKMVNNAIGTVEKNLMEGALIVVFVLVVFLGNLRAGLIVASVIPLAMLFAIIMMNAFGVSGNLMSLGALDFGLIVDGAVIIVESVMHQLAHNDKFKNHTILSSEHMDETVRTASSKMMNSAVFGQIIILIVYLPIFTLEGIEGKMFKPMAQTVAFALLGAFVLSLTYIPMMSAFFLSKNVKHKRNISDKIMYKVEYYYDKLLHKLLHYPKLVIFSVLALFAIALCVLSSLGGEFIPALEEGDFAVDTRVLTGSNLTTTIESTQQAAHILKSKFPEVIKVVTKIGSGEVPTDPMPMEASDMMVILKDKSEWTTASSFDELADKMGKALEDVPGITAGFQYPVQMRFNELMTGARQDVVCKIFGENLDSLASSAHHLSGIISSIEGVENIFVEPVTGLPQLIIEFNRPMLAQYNISISEINKIINTAFAGQSTGLVFEEEKRFDLVVRLDQNQRKNLEDVQSLLIPCPNGSQIPLSRLANVSIKNGPNQIQREDAKRRIVVGFNVKGRDVQSIVKELQLKVGKNMLLPTGYYITYGGAFENLIQAKNRLMIAVPVSLLLIFVLLFFAFNSIKHGLLIYTAIPLSAIGGIFFLALRDMPFSISAGVGFIALFGVAVLNGIVLIAEFNRLRKDNESMGLRAIVLQGTRMRLRPVLMTAFVASLGFLPMALSQGAGAEVQRPLATVVIGGLLIATLLTLFVLPILYILFEKGVKFKVKNSPKSSATIFVFFAFSLGLAHAQSILSLDQAIGIAMSQNGNLNIEKLKASQTRGMISTAIEIPKTNVVAELGQVNSALFDSKFGVSQSISFPTVYKKQRDVYHQVWKLSEANIMVKEFELKKLISKLYFEHDYLRKKQKLLLKADSLYSLFLNKSKIRVELGEVNGLEKISAEQQKMQIDMQLNQLRNEMYVQHLSLQYLLNTSDSIIMNLDGMEDRFVLTRLDSTSHPFLKSIEAMQLLAKSETALEKARMKPDLILGYFNNSFRGNGPDNVNYTASSRFSSIQIGMGISIFSKAQKAKIAAANLKEDVLQNEYEIIKKELISEKKIANAELSNLSNQLSQFESKGLKHAENIESLAYNQYFLGAINFVDYMTLTNQSIFIRNQYIETLRLYYDSLIELKYPTIK